MRLLISIICLLTVTPLTYATDHNPAEPEIREWQVPWENTRPRDPAVAADGRVWFVGQAGHYVAVFNPEDESFQRFDLDDGTGPHTVIVTRDQEIWYAGNRAAHLGKVNPDDGTITKVETPAEGGQDPHSMAEDAQGRIWFTAQWGNHIGRYDRQTGEISLATVQTDRARPYGIGIDAGGRVWSVLLGTNRLAMVEPESMQLTEIELPRADARPRRIAVLDSGVWYVDYDQGYLGAYRPESDQFSEWRAPGEDKSGPYAMTADSEGRLWFVETWQQPNRFVGFDPATEEFFATATVPSGGGTVRHMIYDPDSDSIWFGTDTNHLGQTRIKADSD